MNASQCYVIHILPVSFPVSMNLLEKQFASYCWPSILSVESCENSKETFLTLFRLSGCIGRRDMVLTDSMII
jgi:hypothetical protein